MEASTKKILGSLAVVAAIGGGFYLIKKGKKLLSGAKMNFALLGFRIHKMTMQEVQFAVKLRCYNPTNLPIKLVVNQVVANYKGSAIAYSTPDIKGLTIGAGTTQESEILFQVPYLNLMGKGLTMAVLQNMAQLKADMTFTLTLSINGETITTTQNLTDNNMNGLPIGQLGIVSGPRNTKDGSKFNYLIKKAAGTDTFIKNAGVSETLKEGTKLIDEIFTTQEEKLQGKMELFKIAVTDRGSAREMYEKDSWLQKIFAIFFLVAWVGLTALMLSYFILGNIHLENWQIAFVSTINGGISNKLSTIVDFLFGGAISSVNNVKLKNKRKNENI